MDLCQLWSRADGITRSFNSRAMDFPETMPALRSFRIVGAKALARVSAACVCHSPLLILPFVIRPRRASTLATVVRCHLPPFLVGTSLRFNSFASAAWDTNPAAKSSRRIEAKARAREPATRLLANAPWFPLLREEAFPRAFSIGHHARTSTASARQQPVLRLCRAAPRWQRAPQAKARPGSLQTRTGL